MPQKDTLFNLEVENGKQYHAKYLARKSALSGGWRGFSIAEKLVEGDVLLYILRKSNLTKNDKSRVIQSLPTEVTRSGQEVGTLEHAIETNRPSSLSEGAQDKVQVFLSEDDPCIIQQADKIEKERSVNPGNSEHVLLSDSFVVDSGIASFEEFQTVIDDLLKKKYDLPHDIKQSYYQLCCSQDTLLHINLLKGINPVLIAGSIIETVNVAAVIKSCKLHNFKDEFSIWDEKLKSLKILGMKVGFLRSHLDRLQRIASDSEAAKNKQQYQNLCAEQDVSESKIKDLEAKLSEVLRVFDKRSGDIEELKLKIENHKFRFQKQVSVQWW
uniref:TF-B3 domain-containing protein n=1 Tax=Chenopodium quinoa TaxID=63459 RepID=A0A803KXV7_CHEQI